VTTIVTAQEFFTFTNEDLSALPLNYVDNVLLGISAEVRKWTDRDHGADTYTDERVRALAMTYNGQACLEVLTLHSPISSVSAFAMWYAVDVDPTTLSVTDVVLNPASTGFWIPFGAFGLWQSFVRIGNDYVGRVTYVAGTAADYAVKMGVALLAQEWFALMAETSQDSADHVESWRLGDYQEKKAARDLAASGGLGLGTQLSQRAYRLLDHYRSRGVTFL
jgi:hypothetical protein